jgi:hypothetical protein
MSFVDDLIHASTFGLVDTNFFGGEDPSVQGYAQSRGQKASQQALFPLLQQGIGAGRSGGQLYPVADTPRTPSARGYNVPSQYNVPTPQYQSPADFAGGYDTILQRLIEPFGESLGSARGGWSGSGQDIVGQAFGREIAPQIMSQYTQYQQPFNDYAFNQARDPWQAQLGANQYMAQAQNQFGSMGYGGELQRMGALNQSYASPWNLTSLYSGTYGNPIVNPGSEGFGQSLPFLAALAFA